MKGRKEVEMIYNTGCTRHMSMAIIHDVPDRIACMYHEHTPIKTFLKTGRDYGYSTI